MKRFLILIAVVLPMIARAQEMNDEKNLVMKWGVSASIGMDVYNASSQPGHSLNIGLGCSMGVHYRAQWRKGWFVEPGVTVGYDHYNLHPALREDPTLKLDRWHLGVPVMGGYRFRNGLAPLIGVEYDWYFSTTTSGQEGTPRYSSSQLWKPSGVAAFAGLGFESDFGEVAMLFHSNVMRANKREHLITAERNIIPMQVTLTAKFFFSCR